MGGRVQLGSVGVSERLRSCLALTHQLELPNSVVLALTHQLVLVEPAPDLVAVSRTLRLIEQTKCISFSLTGVLCRAHDEPGRARRHLLEGASGSFSARECVCVRAQLVLETLPHIAVCVRM